MIIVNFNNYIKQAQYVFLEFGDWINHLNISNGRIQSRNHFPCFFFFFPGEIVLLIYIHPMVTDKIKLVKNLLKSSKLV